MRNVNKKRSTNAILKTNPEEHEMIELPMKAWTIPCFDEFRINKRLDQIQKYGVSWNHSSLVDYLAQMI